jgi:hypothetical protein
MTGRIAIARSGPPEPPPIFHRQRRDLEPAGRVQLENPVSRSG